MSPNNRENIIYDDIIDITTNNEVYTIDDLRSLYNNYNIEMRNHHIQSVVKHIKRRILAAARVGLESHIVRRIVRLEDWQSYARRGVLKANGLLENDSISVECIHTILQKLHTMFPDCYFNLNSNDNTLFIGWTL